jgi:hypothetical protein
MMNFEKKTSRELSDTQDDIRAFALASDNELLINPSHLEVVKKRSSL